MGHLTYPRGRTTRHRSSRSLRAVRPAGIETASCWDKHQSRRPETLHMLGKNKPAETPPWDLSRLLQSAQQVSATKNDRTGSDSIFWTGTGRRCLLNVNDRPCHLAQCTHRRWAVSYRFPAPDAPGIRSPLEVLLGAIGASPYERRRGER